MFNLRMGGGVGERPVLDTKPSLSGLGWCVAACLLNKGLFIFFSGLSVCRSPGPGTYVIGTRAHQEVIIPARTPPGGPTVPGGGRGKRRRKIRESL